MKNLGPFIFAVVLTQSLVANAASEKEESARVKNELIPLFVGTECLTKPGADQVNKAYQAATKACDTKTFVECKNAAGIAKVMRTVFSFYAESSCDSNRPKWNEVKKAVESVRYAEAYLNTGANTANGKVVSIKIMDGVTRYESLLTKKKNCLTDDSADCLSERAKNIGNIQSNLANALNMIAAAAPSAPTMKEKLTNAKQTVVSKFRTLKGKITGPKK